MNVNPLHRLLALIGIVSSLFFSSASGQDVVWRRTLDNDPANRDTARSMAPLANGDLVVGGQSGPTATANFIVYRLNGTTGAVMWTRTLDSGFNQDDVNDLIADPATGDTYICGRAGSANNDLNWYVMKINGSDGTNAWAAPYTFNQTNENDEPRALAFVQDGAVTNVVVVGSITNSGFPQGRIVKLNASTGALIWGTNVSQQLWAVVTDSSGNIFCGGETFAVSNQATITKFNISGTQQWHKTYAPNGGSFNRWNKLALDAASGDVITGGLILGPAADNDIGTARYASSDGTQVWSRLINGTFGAANDSCSSITVDSGGDAYVTGFYRATSTNADWYAARLNIATGAIVWEKTYNGTQTGNEQLENLRVVGSTVYLAGYMRNTVASVAARTMRVMKLAKADGSTLLVTDFLDRVGPQVIGNKALIVAANGDMIVSGDSAVTSNAAEIARFGVVGAVAVAPTVTTDTQSSVTHNSATLGGNVTADGGASVTERGIVWGTATGPTTANNKVANGSGTGTFSATINSLPSSTTVFVRAYAINTAGTGYGNEISFLTAAPPAPEIAVTENAANVADGGSLSFGTTTVGSPVTKTFTVTNSGTANLTLSGLTVPSGFSIAANFGSTTVAPSGSTTFQITMSAGAAATPNGSLSFTNNDSDENPYNFTISGTVNPAPAPEIAVTESAANVADGGSLGFGTTTVGTPVTKTFTVTNSGTANLTLSGLTVPSGFSIAANFGSTTIAPSGSTTFQVTMSAGAAATPSGSLSFTNNDTDENPFNFTISGTVNPPPAPTVTGVTSSTADGAYGAGTVIPIQVSFSANVDATGTPTLALSSGGSASYASGSGSSTLTFSYTVGAGQNAADLDYGSTSALALSGGSIVSSVGAVSANLTLPSPSAAGSLGANKALVIDTLAPTVVSVVRLTPSAQATSASSVTFRVTYSEPVTLTAPATSRFAIASVNGGTVTGTIASVSGSGNTRDVTVNITGGSGEFRLRVLD